MTLPAGYPIKSNVLDRFIDKLFQNMKSLFTHCTYIIRDAFKGFHTLNGDILEVLISLRLRSTPFTFFSGHIAEELWLKDYNFDTYIALAIFNGYNDVGDKWMLYPII